MMVIVQQVSEIPSAVWSLATINLLLRLGLSLVMLVAAIGKLQDSEGGREILEAVGVPNALTAWILVALPCLEAVLGLTMLYDSWCRTSSLILALLFATFGLAIIKVLLKKEAPPCNCLGAFYSAPVSKVSLIRAVALSGLASICFVLPTYKLNSTSLHSVAATAGYISIAYALNEFLGWRSGATRSRAHPLESGLLFPKVETTRGLSSGDILAHGSDTLVLFTSPECDSCFELKQSLFHWAKTISGSVSVVELSARTGRRRPVEVRLPVYRELELSEFRRFGLQVPSAVLVDASRIILEPPVSGGSNIRTLIRFALKRSFRDGPRSRP